MDKSLIKRLKSNYDVQSLSTSTCFFNSFIRPSSCRRFTPTLLHVRAFFSFKILLISLFTTLNQPLLSAENKDKSYTVTSSDNKFIISKASVENTLIIKDAKTQHKLKLIPIINKQGESSGISGIHDASTRNSFIVALKNSPEIWEINYQNPAPVGFGTWVHDYRKESGEAMHILFPIRRLMLKVPLDNFFFDDEYVNIISVSCNGSVQIIDLDLGKKVAMLHLSENNFDNKNPYKIKNLNHNFFSKIIARATQFKLENCN